MDAQPNPTPGKFEGSGAKGELFYAMSLDSVDDEAGDSSEGVWAGLLMGPFLLGDLAKEFPKEYARLDEDDKDDIARAKGAIVTEDSQGFVDMELFTNGAELNRHWEKLASELEGEEVEEEEGAEAEEAGN